MQAPIFAQCVCDPPRTAIPNAIEADIERHHVLHLSITSLADLDNVAVNARWFMPGERFGGQLRHALTYVTEKRAANETVIVVSQQIDRIVELWQEQSTQFAPKLASITEPLHNDSLIFVSGSLTEGWSAPHGDMPLHLLTDAEIFNWSRPEPRRRTAGHAKRGKLPESDYSAWENGDYVVHVDYGIGRFAGGSLCRSVAPASFRRGGDCSNCNSGWESGRELQ